MIHGRRTRGFRFFAWVTLLSVYYSSFLALLPNRVIAQEIARIPEAAVSTTDNADEEVTQDSESARRQSIDAFNREIDLRVERFQLAQAQTEPVDATAAQMLSQAEDADRNNDHIGAATIWFTVADEFGSRAESGVALRNLTGYALRMTRGEFPQSSLLQFESQLPSYEECRSVDSKYVFMAFQMSGALASKRRGETGHARRLAANAIRSAWRFVEDFPNHYLQLYAATYILTASELLGDADEERAAIEFETFVNTHPASFARVSALVSLATHYSAHGDLTRASALRKEFLRDWQRVDGEALLSSAIAPHEVKSFYLMNLGIAYRDARDYVSALASFETVTNALPYSAFETEASTMYAIGLRYRLFPKLIEEYKADYIEFLTQYPESSFERDARIQLAGLYMATDDYNSAYSVYDSMLQSARNARDAEAASSGLEYIVQRELAVSNAGLESPQVLAMACGPLALRNLLARSDADASIPQLIRLARTTDSGTSMRNLIAAAEHYGVELEGVRAGSLEGLSAPFIAFVRENHFVLVEEFDDSTVTIRDMWRRAETVTRAEFYSDWAGEALCASGSYRFANSIASDELETLLGGFAGLLCQEDENGDLPPGCVYVPEDDSPPQQFPEKGEPEESCPTGCNGDKNGSLLQGGTTPAPKPDTCDTDPWYTGPGMPVSGLHQSGDYIDVSIPSNVGSVFVNPFTMEQRIDRTDLVVSSVGSLEFALTKTYSNPRAGTRLWIDGCGGFAICCGETTEGEISCDIDYCISRNYGLYSYGQVPSWRSNYDLGLYRQSASVVTIGQSWSLYNPEFDLDSTQGNWEIYLPESGDTDLEIWYHTISDYYLLKRDDGYQWRFDGDGKLEWLEDASGNRMTYVRSGGVLSQIQFPSVDGRVIAFSTDHNTVQLKQGSTVLRTVEYVSGTDSDGIYQAVKYDGQEVVRYYSITKYNSGTSLPGPVSISDCTDYSGGIYNRGNIYEHTWIKRIKDANQIQNSSLGSYQFDYSVPNSLGGPGQMTISLPNGLVTTITRTPEITTEANVSVSPAGRTMNYKRNGAYKLSERGFYNYDTSDWEKWQYVYNTDGTLSEVKGPGTSAGTVATWARYDYDAGRLDMVRVGPDPSPPTRTWTYTSGYPFPTKMTDPTGVETVYTYDSTVKTRLTAVKPPSAIGTSGYVFAYNSRGEVTTITDPLSKVWTYDYDQYGNVDYVENPLDEVVELEWNALGQLEAVHDPMDKRTEFDYVTSSCGACGPTGQLKEVRRYYTVSSTEYHRLTEFAYDDNGNLQFVTDPAGNTVGYTYDAMNQLETITYPYGETSAKTTNIVWRPYGQVKEITDAKGKKTTFAYEPNYRLDEINDPLAAGPVLLEYARFPRLKKVIDANGRAWTYTYDNRQRLTDITDSQNKNLHYALDAAGRVTQVSAGTGGAGSGGTYPIAYTYDTGTGGSHKGTLTRVDYGASSAGGYSAFGYNGRGELTSLTDPARVFFSMDPLAYAYDDAGRLTSVTDESQVLSYAYNDAGAVTDMTDWDGNVTHYGYNDLHELTGLTYLYGTGNAKSWSFAYNVLGQPDSYTHPNNMVTDYVYDAFGVLTDIKHKSGSTVKQGFAYEYDDVYNITKVTHEDGAYWTYGYDDRASARLTSAVRHNAADTIKANYAYVYDDGDNMTSKTEPWADDFSDGSTSGDWNTTGTWSASTKAAKNTASGSACTLYRGVNDDDAEWRYTYSIDSYTATPSLAAHFRYNTSSDERLLVASHLDKMVLAKYNGTTWTVYNNTSVTSTAGVRYKVRIEADGANVKVWRSPASGGAETLVFDRTDMPTYNGNQFLFVVSPNTSMSIDDVMIVADDLSRSTTMTYRNNNEIITAADYNGTATYTHDAWGRTNTVAKNSVTKTYSWTSANMLGGIDSSDSNETDVAYTYNGALQRTWRLENGNLKNSYKWDAGFNTLSEVAWDAWTPVGEKAFVPGLAEVDMWSTPSYAYMTHDHLGSTRGMWDGSIAQSGSWEFDPYGSPYRFAGPAGVTQLYTGHDLDPVTGQYYAPFRYLDPAVGRWLSQDPLGMVDGINKFSYALSSPVVHTDPLGLWVPLLLGIWAVVEAGLTAYDLISTGQTLADPNASTAKKAGAVGGLALGMALPGGGLSSGTRVVCKGQFHHGISRQVHNALEESDTLKGLYRFRDPRFVTRAKDLASHNGYQTWHRNLDFELAEWIRRNPTGTPPEFEAFLRQRYNQADLLDRFPNGL